MSKDMIKPKVMLVEDCIITQKANSALLKKHGCLVDIAPDVATAIKLFKPEYYDLILLDMELPDLPGAEFSRYVRYQEPRHQNGAKTPIISLSANQDNELPSLCAGANSFYPKPLTAETLEFIIKLWLLRIPPEEGEIANF